MRILVACLMMLGAAHAAPASAWAEGSGSPAGIAKKGKWVMGLGAGGASGQEMSGGAEATHYGVGHYRGYGVTDWLTAYVKVGGAYVEIDDPTIITAATAGTQSFGGNLLTSAQLKARLWQKPEWGLEWDGALRYTDMRGHSGEKNQLRSHHWKLATSVAKSLGKFTPYLGLSYSRLDITYRIRQNGQLLQQGTYELDQPVGLFVGTDYILGKSEDASVNVEASFLNGGEVNVAMQYLF